MFHPRHAWGSIKTIFRNREGGKRLYLILLAISIAFELAPFAGKGQIEYLYVRTRFGWQVDEFSTFSTVDSIIVIAGEIVFIPLFGYLKLRESIMLILLGAGVLFCYRNNRRYRLRPSPIKRGQTLKSHWFAIRRK